MKINLMPISDYKCGDFHITPVLTFSRPQERHSNIKWGFGIALEWGYWALILVFYKPVFNENN